MNVIPVMDDPLGKHWDQPRDIRSTLMDDKHVILDPAQRAQLHKYNSTMPTGVYPGKCWLRIEGGVEFLLWYGPETPEHTCQIMGREVLRL